MKEFKISVEFRHAFMVEPRNCPWIWKGSGDFDVEEQEDLTAEFEIFAETEASARSIVENYKFSDDYQPVLRIDIKKVDVIAEELDDNIHEEIIDVVIHDRR